MEIVRKVFPVKASDASVAENRISGAASVMGLMDSSWAKDVMCPGCYKGALDSFKRDGFVPQGHDWHNYAQLVAMPMVAEERGKQLYTEAVFHSTTFAQEVRTVCQERLANGMTVGLSVGFGMEEGGCVWFPNGKELWAWATGKGFDMSLFDPAIQIYEDDCRAISQVSKLYEYSIVTVPANPAATVQDCKSLFYGEGLTLADRFAKTLAVVDEVFADLSEVSEMRSAEKRRVSEARIGQATELLAKFQRLVAKVSDPGEAPEEEADDRADQEKALLLDAELFLLTA